MIGIITFLFTIITTSYMAFKYEQKSMFLTLLLVLNYNLLGLPLTVLQICSYGLIYTALRWNVASYINEKIAEFPAFHEKTKLVGGYLDFTVNCVPGLSEMLKNQDVIFKLNDNEKMDDNQMLDDTMAEYIAKSHIGRMQEITDSLEQINKILNNVKPI